MKRLEKARLSNLEAVRPGELCEHGSEKNKLGERDVSGQIFEPARGAKENLTAGDFWQEAVNLVRDLRYIFHSGIAAIHKAKRERFRRTDRSDRFEQRGTGDEIEAQHTPR